MARKSGDCDRSNHSNSNNDGHSIAIAAVVLSQRRYEVGTPGLPDRIHRQDNKIIDIARASVLIPNRSAAIKGISM
jgi:hypothetical protein